MNWRRLRGMVVPLLIGFTGAGRRRRHRPFSAGIRSDRMNGTTRLTGSQIGHQLRIAPAGRSVVTRLPRPSAPRGSGSRSGPPLSGAGRRSPATSGCADFRTAGFRQRRAQIEALRPQDQRFLGTGRDPVGGYQGADVRLPCLSARYLHGRVRRRTHRPAPCSGSSIPTGSSSKR